MVPEVRMPWVVVAMTCALLFHFPAPPLACSSTLSQADPEEVSPAIALRYRDMACRGFASVSTGDRTVAALAVTEDGLLLVPAHLLSLATGLRVVASRTGDDVIACSSDAVTVVGIHPRLDLALIQARMPDPRFRFQPIALAGSRIAAGDGVYLSHPFQSAPRKRRALTSPAGEREGYFRLEPQGRDETRDLGWFVFDEEARAVGLVSWVLEDGEVVARALHLAGLKREEFISAADVRRAPERKESLIHAAEKLLQRSSQGFRDPLDEARALFLIELALLSDPGGIERLSNPARAVAEKSREARQRFMSAETDKLFIGFARPDSRPPASPPPKPSRPVEGVRPRVPDPPSAFVAARIRVATEYIHAGHRDTAAGILEDVTREYPKDPQIDEARRLLAELFGQKP